MTARLLLFVACLAGGGIAGWLMGDALGSEAGLAAGAVLWFGIETTRALRVLRWLRSPDLRDVPSTGGAWGEAVDRMRRALAVRERQREEAEGRLQDFLDAIRGSPNGVVLLDARGRIEWLNETAAAHFGLDAERDLQQQVVNLLRDPDFSAFFNARRHDSDVVIPAPGSTAGRPRRLSLHLHPYGEGRTLLLSRDVTALEQAETMRRDFVANVSHEIRTPLTVLGGFVETLDAGAGDDAATRKRFLGIMGEQASRMARLVNDLLSLSRLEGSPLPGQGEWTPAPVFVAQCEQEGHALADALGKKLDLRFEPSPDVAVAGTQGELQSAFSNLVTNAIRYTPSGGSVEAALRVTEDGRMEWTVRDTGPGIAAEHLPRLTERFYRVDRSRSRETGGTGLGLAIVKHVVQRHGGELKIASTPGAGSVFTIVLPSARVRPLDATPSDTSVRPATESAAG